MNVGSSIAVDRATSCVLITGPGRSGTTFLHRVLERVGLSKLCRETPNTGHPHVAPGGMSNDLVRRHPYFLRDMPNWTDEQLALVKPTLAHTFLCVRDAQDTAESWLKRSNPHWKCSKDATSIRRLLTQDLGEWICWATEAGLSWSVIAFARRGDPDYLYRALAPVWALRGPIPWDLWSRAVRDIFEGPSVS